MHALGHVQPWEQCSPGASTPACAPVGAHVLLGVRCHGHSPQARGHQGAPGPSTYGMAMQPWACATLSACAILAVFASLSVHDLRRIEDPQCRLVLSLACAWCPSEGCRSISLARLGARSLMDTLIHGARLFRCAAWLV